MNTEQMTYQTAAEELRKIVSDIERGELDVDLLSANVKRATELIRICKEKLYKVDEDIKNILKELE